MGRVVGGVGDLFRGGEEGIAGVEWGLVSGGLEWGGY